MENTINFEDPRVDSGKYYYLDDDKLKHITKLKDMVGGVIYFFIGSTPSTPSDVQFMFVKCTEHYSDFDVILGSTDWKYFPLFLKKNVKEKLKELNDEQKNITV